MTPTADTLVDAAWSLQRAIYARLVGDRRLTGLLGGARIYDKTPRDVAFPYVSFGRTSTFDWSTDNEAGEEHIFTLHVWSREAGRRQALAVVAAIGAALDDAALTLEHHHLVNLQREYAEVVLEADRLTLHAMVRFRAVTEPKGKGL